MVKKTKKPKTKALSVKQKDDVEWWKKLITEGKAGEEVKSRMSRSLYDISPENLYEECAKTAMVKIAGGEKLNKEDTELIDKVSVCLGFENGLSMIEAVEVRYRGLMINFKKELIKEYDCNTISEKALVDTIVNAYARNLSTSKLLVNTMALGHTTPILNNYLSIMSKEIDRANRQFITALETLKNVKQPKMKVNVKANNAFVGQNQQFNSNKDNNNENIKTK